MLHQIQNYPTHILALALCHNHSRVLLREELLSIFFIPISLQYISVVKSSECMAA